MKKKLSKEYVDNCTIKELTEEYNREMKEQFGTDKIRIKHIKEFLCCKSNDTVYRHIKGVPHYGKTKLFRTVDLAKHFAEKQVL